jgi:serine phosphatase RsbU (regulator of sigma subunit)
MEKPASAGKARDMKSGNSISSDLTILVIEDDRATQQQLATFLQNLGMRVVLACHPEEGMEKFHSASPDLVLIDIHLPKASSFGMLEELAALAPDLPLVVLAERGNKADLMQALRLGVSDYLILPLADDAMLEHSINNSLRRARLIEENSRIRKKLVQINSELERRIEVFQQDQQAGRHVQINMLPIPPQQISRYVFNHKVIPSLYLSGDTVDYKQVSRHEILFYIADVSGHGSSSAFITVLLRFRIEQMRRDYLRGRFNGVFTPARLLDILNHDLIASALDKHVTLFMGLLNDADDTLTYSVAGHHPLPLLYHQGKAAPVAISRHSFPIGLFQEAQYIDDALQLPREFALLLFSDGILEHIKTGTLEEKEASLAAAVAASEGDFERLRTALKLNKSVKAPDDIAIMSVSGA